MAGKKKKVVEPEKVLKRKSVALDGSVYKRIRNISDATGMSLPILVRHLLSYSVKLLEDGGKLSVNIEDGSVDIGGFARPLVPPPIHTPTPRASAQGGVLRERSY